jgi:hypothetical protein
MLWLIDHFEALKDHVSENYIDMGLFSPIFLCFILLLLHFSGYSCIISEYYAQCTIG